jgi:hypothetical protein
VCGRQFGRSWSDLNDAGMRITLHHHVVAFLPKNFSRYDIPEKNQRIDHVFRFVTCAFCRNHRRLFKVLKVGATSE